MIQFIRFQTWKYIILAKWSDIFFFRWIITATPSDTNQTNKLSIHMFNTFIIAYRFIQYKMLLFDWRSNKHRHHEHDDENCEKLNGIIRLEHVFGLQASPLHIKQTHTYIHTHTRVLNLTTFLNAVVTRFEFSNDQLLFVFLFFYVRFTMYNFCVVFFFLAYTKTCINFAIKINFFYQCLCVCMCFIQPKILLSFVH